MVVTSASSKSIIIQIAATSMINVINLSDGAGHGWVSPFLPLLQSPDTPLIDTGPVSIDQASWIGSVLCLGGLFGSLPYCWLVQQFGIKWALVCLAIPNITSWTLIYWGTSVYHVYISRILAGICGGGILVTFPLYTTDISNNQIRGILGSGLAFFTNLGILAMYIMGNLLSYHTVAAVVIVLSTIYLILVCFLPDTPQSLLRRGQIDAAKKSYLTYKGFNNSQSNSTIEDDFKTLTKAIQSEKTDKIGLNLEDFTSKTFLKGISIGVFLMFLNQFCGAFSILTYAETIFRISGSVLDPGKSTIALGAIQIIGTFVSFVLIDLAGRKILLIVSTVGVGLGMAALGAFSYLRELQWNLEGFHWLPVTSLSFAVLMFSIGLCGIPYFIIPELLPPKMSNVGNTIGMISIWIATFTCLKIVPVLLTTIKLYGVLAIFSATCVLGTIVTILFLPETKGRNLIDISQ
ncbi:facilitated trehalose transporter Tret1-like [Uranotaenia lowii]|uniref:facilitated trehalose transporter Tret1-like n=1 Tax=Uranotaenia lowii TaxID=190385 RepID=UPI0024794589|nr:facilitated trehalose transporter Tret1-like [Uranotaenia lowii]